MDRFENTNDVCSVAVVLIRLFGFGLCAFFSTELVTFTEIDSHWALMKASRNFKGLV